MLRTLLLVANVIVAFYLTPFLIHALGDRWYGMWTLVATFMGYYGYLDFGVSVSAQRFIAGAIGRKDSEETNRLVTSAFVLFFVIGLIVLCVTLLIAGLAPVFLSDATEVGTFRTVLAVLALNAALTFWLAPVNGLMTGHLRYDIATYIQLGKLLVRTLLIVFFIDQGYSIVALALITLLADAGGNFVKLLAARRLFPEVTVARRFFVADRLRELFGYGGKAFVNQMADLLRFQIDHLVVAAFMSLSAVTVFNIAGQIVYYFRTLMTALMGVLIPVYARYQAARDGEATRKAYYFTSKLAAAIALLLGGSIVIFGDAFIRLWIGPDYVEAYTLVVVLVVPTVLFISQQPALALIFGLGAVGPLARVSIAEAVSNLVLSLILVQHYGLLGVALGTAIPLSFYSLYLLHHANRLLGTPLSAYARCVGPVFGLGLLLQTGTWFLLDGTRVNGFLELALLGSGLFAMQVLLLGLLTFSGTERRLLLKTSRQALGRT